MLNPRQISQNAGEANTSSGLAPRNDPNKNNNLGFIDPEDYRSDQQRRATISSSALASRLRQKLESHPAETSIQTDTQAGLFRSTKFRNYELGVLGGLAIGIFCALTYVTVAHVSGFIAISLGSLTIAPWLAALIGATILISAIVSGASYIGRAIDTFSGNRTIIDFFRWAIFGTKTPGEPVFNNEGLATIIGTTLGLIFGILLISGGITIPFISALGVLPELIFVVVTISQLAGLCARIARVFDRKYNNKTIFHHPKVKAFFNRLADLFSGGSSDATADDEQQELVEMGSSRSIRDALRIPVDKTPVNLEESQRQSLETQTMRNAMAQTQYQARVDRDQPRREANAALWQQAREQGVGSGDGVIETNPLSFDLDGTSNTSLASGGG